MFERGGPVCGVARLPLSAALVSTEAPVNNPQIPSSRHDKTQNTPVTSRKIMLVGNNIAELLAFMLQLLGFVVLCTHHFQFTHCHFHLLLRRPAHLLSPFVHARRVIANSPLQLAISLRPESSDDVTNMIVQSFTSSSLCSLTPNNPLLCLSPAARSMLS